MTFTFDIGAEKRAAASWIGRVRRQMIRHWQPKTMSDEWKARMKGEVPITLRDIAVFAERHGLEIVFELNPRQATEEEPDTSKAAFQAIHDWLSAWYRAPRGEFRTYMYEAWTIAECELRKR